DVTLVETLPREDGMYDIAISVLNNPSFPMFRYLIGDITDAPLEKPLYGFSILKNVVGRNNDFIVSKSGQCMHPIRFDAFFKYESKFIRRYRVCQRADGSLHIAVETDKPQSLDIKNITQKIRDLVEGFPVNLDVVNTIPLTASAKHRPVTSELWISPGKRTI
ncbi:unnamed protein product, partial [marine sediment metagenome]